MTIFIVSITSQFGTKHLLTTRREQRDHQQTCRLLWPAAHCKINPNDPPRHRLWPLRETKDHSLSPFEKELTHICETRLDRRRRRSTRSERRG
jgi:hypothetical protein